MKVTKSKNNQILYVEVNEKVFPIVIPAKLRDKEVRIDKNKDIWLGNYKYNPEDDTWDKVGKFLQFLMGLFNLVKGIFKKKE